MERSKKLNILLISYLAFAICIAIVCACMANHTLSSYSRLEALALYEIERLQNSALVSGKEEGAEGFILKSEDGKIGLFSEEGQLLETINVNIKTLPVKDRLMLNEGIAVSSREELNSLIQDYTS